MNTVPINAASAVSADAYLRCVAEEHRKPVAPSLRSSLTRVELSLPLDLFSVDDIPVGFLGCSARATAALSDAQEDSVALRSSPIASSCWAVAWPLPLTAGCSPLIPSPRTRAILNDTTLA